MKEAKYTRAPTCSYFAACIRGLRACVLSFQAMREGDSYSFGVVLNTVCC
jgi:hypothetical protein